MSFIFLDPPDLIFHPGFNGEQRLSFDVVLVGIDPLLVEVRQPRGGAFSWSLPQGGRLTPVNRRIPVEVIFNAPPNAPPVTEVITVEATEEPGVWLGPPAQCELKGNVPGVGPDALSMELDRRHDILYVINTSGVELDLSNCSFGDCQACNAGEPRTLSPTRGLDIFWKRTLAPSEALRVAAPVWNNTGDIVWIKNEIGQEVARYTHTMSRTCEVIVNS